MALVRLHTEPLGLIDLAFDGEEDLGAAGIARQVWANLGDRIVAHLREDRLPPAENLSAAGLPVADVPQCLRAREARLADAPFASIVIATHDRPASLAVTLDSLMSLNYPRYEIIVVDNAPSSSATADLIASAYRDGPAPVRYLREDEPGLGRAHNRAIPEVMGSIVAFTDDDVIVDRNWLAELVRGFEFGDRVGCVTGLVVPMELATRAQVLFEQFGGFNKGFDWKIFDLKENRPKSPLFPYSAGWFGSGNGMAFKTSVLRQMGGFDAALGAGSIAVGGDDLESFFEVIWRGYQLVYQPSSVVHHQHRRDYPAFRRQVEGYGLSFTAYLTSLFFQRPILLADVAWRLPFGLKYLLGQNSRKNANKGADYPQELTRLERTAMFRGPMAYVRSYRRARQVQKTGRTVAGAGRSMAVVVTPTIEKEMGKQ